MSQENNDWHLQRTYDSLMTYGLNGIKYVPLINGGAIIAILTFLGNNPSQAASLKEAAYYFIWGVIIGGLLNITAYFTQLTLYNEERGHRKLLTHEFWLYLTVALIVIRAQKPWEHTTGPKTPEGKKAAARNAMHHGLDSREMAKIRRILRLQRHFVQLLMASNGAKNEAENDPAKT